MSDTQDRDTRLAAQLRANLRRRKVQAKGLAARPDGGGDPTLKAVPAPANAAERPASDGPADDGPANDGPANDSEA